MRKFPEIQILPEFCLMLAVSLFGDIQDVIDQLIVAENAERLKESEL